MNLNVIKKLIGMLPEGEKKQELIAKFNQKVGGKEKSGLHDTFEFAPKGHIRIESIDNDGHVLGILADQANLVVKGAEEILLRAFSGDPDQILYKVRMPKGDVSPKYHVGLSDNISAAVGGVDQLNFAPNVFWRAVDDKDFDVFYSYRPHTVFIKEEAADASQVGKKAFTVHTKNDAPGCIPLGAEIYSTHTNMFIGLGDGKNYPVNLSDARLTYTSKWTDEDGKKVAVDADETIVFHEKISNFVLEYEKSNEGGQIGVYINGVLKDTIETLDSSLVAPEIASKAFTALNNEVETEITIEFSGADASVATPKVVVAGIRFDALSKDMNALIHEFESFTKTFDTQSFYSTTTSAPFMIQLEHFPIDPASLVIEYNTSTLQAVETLGEVAEGKYFVDPKYGKVYFNRALSNLLVTFNVTGEIYLARQASGLTSVTVTRAVANEVPTGVIDGNNKVFQLSKPNVVASSVVVHKTPSGGAQVIVPTIDYTVDSVTGKITFTNGKQPVTGDAILVDYNNTTAAKEITLPNAPKTVQVLEYGTGVQLTVVTDDNLFGKGTYKLDAVNNKIIVSDRNNAGNAIMSYEVFYESDEVPGVPTGYTRAVIEKPKAGTAYPWYQLDKGSVTFIAEFPENTPNSQVTIREMGLFDGPRADDKIEGFSNYPVDAFSLVRVGETRKEVTTGIRVTWTITLLNKDGQPFTGGF
ncbi:hypothetical protein SAMN02799624_05217 [Paenibacillus sp. UNC496MF]|uniref:hypothetical protein n=1 Tax=Paenibacillus sp. UNC496MF TaxID=1502753 RepID=UPI0008E9D859|nr:hypothetical protein [Paenibacillus sp. UNC496MF]SFJ62273.1 hypothetical protein SAMN02799624_05217 [Paenibacillus sp. UNC496MF]